MGDPLISYWAQLVNEDIFDGIIPDNVIPQPKINKSKEDDSEKDKQVKPSESFSLESKKDSHKSFLTSPEGVERIKNLTEIIYSGIIINLAYEKTAPKYLRDAARRCIDSVEQTFTNWEAIDKELK